MTIVKMNEGNLHVFKYTGYELLVLFMAEIISNLNFSCHRIKLGHCIMQFHEFDWLSGHGIYHARQLVTIKLFCGGSCKAKIKI